MAVESASSLAPAVLAAPATAAAVLVLLVLAACWLHARRARADLARWRRDHAAVGELLLGYTPDRDLLSEQEIHGRLT